MSGVPKVALLIETSRGFGRGILRGIVRYARLHGPWAFYITPGDFEQELPKMERWGGTGIIARIENQRIADAILATKLPLVAMDLSEEQLRPGHPLSEVPEVRSDSEAAARLAAEHLLERGFRHYAFVGIPRRVWSRRRQEAFCERIDQAGFAVHVYPISQRNHSDWGHEQTVLARWLSDLPKPVGLMACNDDRGREVLVACRLAGIQVPEQVAVIGVDNDSLLCELSDPPLSSVALNAQRGGYEAAALLDEMMRNPGRHVGPQRIIVPPLHVVTRRSTDILALEDAEIAAALRFIHDNAGLPIQVDDVVRELHWARRTLEMRFQRVVGRSIRAEIERVRMERAKRLLQETDLSIPKIAQAAGFNNPNYFGLVFRRVVGVAPSAYRRQVRG